jgi:hypothetical protein
MTSFTPITTSREDIVNNGRKRGAENELER